MWYKIFKFELHYRKKRPATYIYFSLALIFSFLVFEMVQMGSTSGKVMENAPVKIAQLMAIMSAFFMVISSAVMGVPVLRDFEHQTESLMFVNPIKKRDYLTGRFLGSFAVLLFIYSGMLIGFILSDFAPWRDTDKLLEFSAMTFIQPFLIFVLPNVFFSSAIFFAGGTLSRKSLVVYVQGIFFIVLYILAIDIGASDLSNKTAAMLLDPMGMNTVDIYTEYWTISEQNTLLIPLKGAILWNRIIWFGVGILALVITYFGFSFNVVRKSIFKKKAANNLKPAERKAFKIPKIKPKFGFLTDLKQIIRLSLFYCKSLYKEIPFIALTICGILLIIINAIGADQMMGSQVYPVTYRILNIVTGSFLLFFIIIMVYFSGELIWKERSIKFNQISDVTPVHNFPRLVSKFIGLILSFIILLFMLMLTGIFIQVAHSYYNFEISQYIFYLFGDTLLFLVLFSLVFFFIQVLVNHKFLGYAISIIFFVLTFLVVDTIGLEHRLLQFTSDGMGSFSDMNKHGHYMSSFAWFNTYWFGFSALLFIISVIFSVSGTNSSFKTRLKVSRLRLTRPIIIVSIISLITFVSSGCYIYYNTNVVNNYETENKGEELQAEYEKTLKKYELIDQTRIIDVNLNVNIYPKSRDFDTEGYFILKNKTKNIIKDIHIQLNDEKEISYEYVKFDRKTIIKESFDKFKYYIYELDEALQPGETTKMSFKMAFKTKGFVEGGSNTSVLNNGTFFNNSYFPTLGYNDGYELADDDDRKKHDLAEKERMLERDNPRGLAMNALGDDGDNINFEIVISTSSDQIAIAPGYLQKDWKENGRHYYHYKMDVPIANFYSIVSAKYEVFRDKWNDVDLEIYYHNEHDYNLDIMNDAMKKSFDYFSKNFSPYQYKQMRIMEFPRYRTFAQSFANTVPFSEGIGFIFRIGEDDPNVPFFVTSHELAHQWWGHQVAEANVKGGTMISEGLAQYSSYMVMKHNFKPHVIKEFLKHDLNRYLRGRSREVKKEMPFELCENQAYIHYNKAALIMFAFQDYITEDSVNVALRRFLKDWAPLEGKYPTSKDLLGYYRDVTPDSLQYVITDMFETITLFENKAENAVSEKISDNKYSVTIDVKAQKLRADSLGNENEIKINDWIYIGVYGKDKDDKDKLIYYKKHKIDEAEKTFTVTVEEEPVKAGIDPQNILIDRHPDDNTIDIEEKDLS